MRAPAALTEPAFPPLAISPELVRKILVRFIQNEVQKVGFERVVLGLSGGVDSSLVATLASQALAPGDAFAGILPSKTRAPQRRSAAPPMGQPAGPKRLEVDHTPPNDAHLH